MKQNSLHAFHVNEQGLCPLSCWRDLNDIHSVTLPQLEWWQGWSISQITTYICEIRERSFFSRQFGNSFTAASVSTHEMGLLKNMVWKVSLERKKSLDLPNRWPQVLTNNPVNLTEIIMVSLCSVFWSCLLLVYSHLRLVLLVCFPAALPARTLSLISRSLSSVPPPSLQSADR